MGNVIVECYQLKNLGQEPGALESALPFCGSVKESAYHFRQGNYVRGVLWGGMAVSDVFLIKAIGLGMARLAGKTAASIVIREGEVISAKGGIEAIVHLTNEAAAGGVKSTGKLGGKSGIFGLAAKNVPKSNLGRNLVTTVGINADLSHSIAIPESAVSAFRKPPFFGPTSALRRLTGVRSTSLGYIDLTTGIFVPGKVPINLSEGLFREATFSERAKSEAWRFMRDYGVDGMIYFGGKMKLEEYQHNE